jgi:hypothetical protein
LIDYFIVLCVDMVGLTIGWSIVLSSSSISASLFGSISGNPLISLVLAGLRDEMIYIDPQGRRSPLGRGVHKRCW